MASKAVSVHLQLFPNAEVSAYVNPGDNDGPFMALDFGRYPGNVSVYMPMEQAGDLAAAILRALSDHAATVTAEKVAFEDLPNGSMVQLS